LHYECINELEQQLRAKNLIDINMAFAGGDAATKHLKLLLP